MTVDKTKEEKTQDSSLNPEPGNPNPESEPKITNMFTHGSHGGIDDEYYINEIIGLDDFTYDDWIGDKRLNKKQREEKRKDEYFTNSLGVRMWKGQK
tara:strand:+ start:52 stop:342 length:291 start_codon:yes stop_codon:yes gene_type:complete